MAQDPVKLLAQADKLYSSIGSGLSSWFSSKTDNYENASELYVKAAVAYRVQNKGREAGMAYEKAAAIQGNKLNERNDMANTLQEASKAYRKDCPEDAARCLSQVIQHYLDEGNFRRAAGQEEKLGDLYEEQDDAANARSAYAQAAQWFEDDNAPTTANKLNLKSAQYAALDSDYLDAINRFEHVAQASVKSNTMKHSVPKYLWQAGLCHIALDFIGAKRALEKYGELDSGFSLTPEAAAIAGILEAVEGGDVSKFENEGAQYFRNRSLPSWDATILGRIKKDITDKEEDFS